VSLVYVYAIARAVCAEPGGLRGLRPGERGGGRSQRNGGREEDESRAAHARIVNPIPMFFHPTAGMPSRV